MDLRLNIAHNSPTINSTGTMAFAGLLVEFRELTDQILPQESLWDLFKFRPKYLSHPRQESRSQIDIFHPAINRFTMP